MFGLHGRGSLVQALLLRRQWSRKHRESLCSCFCASSVHSGPGCLHCGPGGTRPFTLYVSPKESPEDTSLFKA